MDRSDLRLIEESIKRGQEFQFIRVLGQNSGKSKRILLAEDKDSEGLSEPLREIFNSIQREMFVSRSPAGVTDLAHSSLEPATVVVEVLRSKTSLVVFGAGHVGQAVGLIGSLLGFEVILIDDRPEFASRERLPDSRIRLIVGDYAKVIDDIQLGINSAVVIVTRGHQFDEVCLRGTVRSNLGYLGMIGSKRRVFSIINRLERDGYSRADFEKLHAPIGLQIGAKSPQEIAVAIIAEIISHFNWKKPK
jgi:xanthine/CO dehydrogenase XdhC/CoxF family maturation factor